MQFFFFSPETDANLFLALVCSSLLLPVHVWLFFLSQLALASRGPRKIQIFVLPIQITLLLPLVYSEQVSGQNGVSGQPASLGLVLCCPLGATFYRPIRETPFPLLAKESFDVNILLSQPSPSFLRQQASKPSDVSSSCMSPLRRPGEDAVVFLPAWDWKPMERRLVPSRLPFSFHLWRKQSL